MTTTPALIVTGNGLDIDNSLPGGRPGRPDQGLPGGRPGHPDNALPPLVGKWPPPVTTWPPIPPITIDIDPDVGISLPIVLPGSPDNGLPPVAVDPGHPANPIVLPPLPEGPGVLVALVIPLPHVEPKAGSPGKPALLWYGPGTIPVMAYIAPMAAPK
jgi:hypothetical protein